MEKVEVQVRRKVRNSYLPTKITNNSKRAIASVYKDKHPLGITDKDLEKKLLMDYLNIDANDRNYGEKRDEFWKNFRLVVPVEGVVLNISTREGEDGEKIPNNLEDYITYKWIQNHPLVAESKKKMQRNPRKEFYIYDPVRETQANNVEVQSKKKAYVELANLADNPEKRDILVRLLIGSDPTNMMEEQKENLLDEFIDKNASKFVDMVTDPDLEIRAELDAMVEKGILRKQGNSFLYMDTTIGDSVAEAISFFKNKRNSEIVLDLRSKLKDLV